MSINVDVPVTCTDIMGGGRRNLRTLCVGCGTTGSLIVKKQIIKKQLTFKKDTSLVQRACLSVHTTATSCSANRWSSPSALIKLKVICCPRQCRNQSCQLEYVMRFSDQSHSAAEQTFIEDISGLVSSGP